MFVRKNFNHIQNSIDLVEPDVQTLDSGRFYSIGGVSLPSVTTVTGWKKRKFFAEWRSKNQKESSRVTRRGNKLHSIIESYLNNEEMKLMDIPPLECDLFLQLKPELDKIDNIIALEVPLWSSTIGLAGRVDCIAEYNGVLNIIDFKGSTKEKQEEHIDNYMMQATAYALMWEDVTKQKIDKFKILVSCETGSIQVFSGETVKWVKPLVETIQDYKRECMVQEM